MSKANGAIENKDTYLQHVSLKNYKSIKDAEIDFKPGLNIIIGKNASGKTNFINGLNKILSYKYNEILASEFVVRALFKEVEVTIKRQPSIQVPEYFLRNNHHSLLKKNNVIVLVNGNTINEDEDKSRFYPPIYTLSERGLYFEKVIIEYGTSYGDSSPFINTPFSFEVIINGNVSENLLYYRFEDKQTKLVNSFFERFYKFLVEINNNGFKFKFKSSAIDLKSKIIEFSEIYFQNINQIISSYSPIQSVRLNKDFMIITDEEGERQTISNFFVEFLIDQSWLPFNLLSAGTKRLFYIISEMSSTYNIEGLLYNTDLNIILLEEPELGIHPHQLHQLMQFIKEQSREKQIILTTHSPQVLDVLEPDELDRVIICHYDSKKGTQLSHLSEKQMAKARKYMKEEAFLSDYWRFSDLEPAN
jgi:predicted ATP-dependent endonuclease of OLD family